MCVCVCVCVCVGVCVCVWVCVGVCVCIRGGQRLRYKDVVKRHLKAIDHTIDHWETLAQYRQQWRQDIHKGKKAILKNIYHKNTNMITISAMVLLMHLPLSSSGSTAGEALNLKSDYSLTNEQRM